MDHAVSVPRRGSLGLADGVRAFAGGIAFVASTPGVWPYAAVPVGMMALLTCLLTVLGVWGASALSQGLLGQAGGWGGQVGHWLATAFLALTAFIVAVLLSLGLAQPLSGFALEKIVREREYVLTGRKREPPSFAVALLNGLQIAAVTITVGGCLLTLLFLVGLLFPPAAVVTVPAKVAVCGWLLAWDFLDYPLGLRGLGVRGRWHWVRRNFEAFTVFGVLWTLLVIVPGIILLLLPMGVAGATQLAVEDERRG